MTTYEAIKNMSFEEMAAMFYIFAKPFMDTLDMTEEQRKEARGVIRDFLKAESGKANGNQGSKKQSQ